jgi:mono/diheme cytochrome c family protein
MFRDSRTRSGRFLGLFLAAGLAGALSSTAADAGGGKLPPPSSKKGLTYEKDMQPIFEKSCFKCHGAEKQKGQLRLDSLAALLKGGEDGKVIEKGNSEKSRLARAVARVAPDDAMPPEGKGDPLTREQVGLIRAWIDQGAR